MFHLLNNNKRITLSVICLVIAAASVFGCSRISTELNEEQEIKALAEADASLAQLTAEKWARNWHTLPESPNGKNYIFERIGVEDGLSQSVVRAVFQDRFGFIWVGTSSGLNRYDGKNFVVFRNDTNDPTTLAGNSIWAVFEDSDGNFWVGTDNGLDLYDREENQFSHFQNDPQDDNSLSNNRIRTIIQSRDGNLWIGTWGGGVNKYDHSTGAFTRFMYDLEDPASISDNFIKVLYEDSKGLIWVGTSKGLNRYDPVTGSFIIFQQRYGVTENITDYETELLYESDYGYFWSGKPTPLDESVLEENPNAIVNNQIQAIIEGEDRQIWVGTAGGLDRFDLTSGRFEHYIFDNQDPDSISSNMILSLGIDLNGDLWVGTNNGLNMFESKKETFVRFTTNPENPEDIHSISNQIINVVMQDNSGSYWLGTAGGLNRFDQSTTLFIHNYHKQDVPDSLSANMVWAIEQQSVQEFWIGTNVGVDLYNTGTGKFRNYPFDERGGTQPEEPQVYAIRRSPSGNVWFGTSAGLWSYDPDQREISRFDNSGLITPNAERLLDESIILSLAEAPDGTLWIGTYGSGLLHLDQKSERITQYSFTLDNPFSISSNIVGVLLIDDDDNLLVGTRGGGLNIFLPESDSFLRLTSDPANPSSLSDNYINSMFQSLNGDIWIATMGGLSLYNPHNQTFFVLTEEDGLASNVTFSVLEDGIGNYWVTTNNGITHITMDFNIFRNFNFQHGLQANEFNPGAALASSRGWLFFGGVNGFNVFDPIRLPDNDYLPPVLLSSLTQSGEPFSLPYSLEKTNEIFLDWPGNYFEFEGAVLNYIQRGENQLAYKLEPLHTDWQYMDVQQTKAFDRLDGGTYSLYLWGSNNNDSWGEPIKALTVEVNPPFWERSAFQLGGAAVAIFLLAVLVQMRVQNIQRYSYKLEAQVEERTYDIQKRRAVAEGLREILLRINSDQSIAETLDFVVCQTNKLMETYISFVFSISETEESRMIAFAIAQDAPENYNIAPQALLPNIEIWKERIFDSREIFTAGVGSRLEQWLADEQMFFRIIPIYSMQSVLGALAVLETPERSINEDDLDLLRSLADQAALALENARLRTSVEEMAVVTERNRIARDMHDAITQTLFSANLIAESLPRVWDRDREKAERSISNLQDLNRSALAEMRSMLLELRPDVITDISLSELIRQLTDTLRGRAGVTVNLSLVEKYILPEKVHQEAYRILQEAVTNIIKHACASHVDISLHTRKYRRGETNYVRLNLWIEDDGTGFDPDSIGGIHFGMKDMRERADTIGAELKVESIVRQGTRIELEWKGKKQDEKRC